MVMVSCLSRVIAGGPASLDRDRHRVSEWLARISLGRTSMVGLSCERAFLHVLFHPDYTVGSGIAPDLLTFRPRPEALAGSGIPPDTAGGEFHPALRTTKVYESVPRECKAPRRLAQIYRPFLQRHPSM